MIQDAIQLATMRAIKALDSQQNGDNIAAGFGIEHGLQKLGGIYLEVAALQLIFRTNGKDEESLATTGGITIPTPVVEEALAKNETIATVVHRIFGGNSLKDPIQELTGGRCSRKILLTEGINHLFELVDWRNHP